MATSYKANSTLTYLNIGNNWSTRLGIDTYAVSRGFLRFDTSAITPDVADITAVDLVMNVETINFNGDTCIIKSSIASDSNDWGTTVEANVDDFVSTVAHDEGTANCTTTGTKTFSIDKTHLDYSGTTWFRLSALNTEWAYSYNVLVKFSSQNSTTESLRPKLVITYTSASGLICRQTLLGCG